MATTPARRDHILATEDEQPLLREIERILATESDQTASLVTSDGESVPLPQSLIDTLREASKHLTNQEGVSIVGIARDLTTQQAADLLNVSRPYLIQLLDEGDIPHHMVGTHRRIALGDLLQYKVKRDAIRREALRELTRYSREIGLYDLPEDQP